MDNEDIPPAPNGPTHIEPPGDIPAPSPKSYVPAGPPKSFKRKILPFLILLTVIVAGTGVYWQFFRTKPEPKTTQPAQIAEPNQQATTNFIDTQTKHHKATNFSLEFDYPANWTITETAGSGQLIAQSPSLRLKDASGQSVTGQIVLKIRGKQQPLPEFDKGNATAVRDSEKIAYTKPTASQRGSTFVSFLRYDGSRGNSTLDGIYITGDTGYKKDQPVPKADFVPVDPIISLIFIKCDDNDCSANGTPLGVTVNSWDDANFGEPLRALLQSFVIN